MRFSLSHVIFPTNEEKRELASYLGQSRFCSVETSTMNSTEDKTCLSALSGTGKRVATVASSALGLCFAHETTSQRFPRLLHLSTPVVLGYLLPFFPFFTLFHNKSHLFLPKTGKGTVNFYFSRLSQVSRLLLPQFLQGYVGHTEHSCSNQRKHQKTRKIAIFEKKLFFFSPKSVP